MSMTETRKPSSIVARREIQFFSSLRKKGEHHEDVSHPISFLSVEFSSKTSFGSLRDPIGNFNGVTPSRPMSSSVAM